MIERCPTCGRRKKRSTDANRRLWALYHEIAEQVKPEGVSYSAETWHRYFCERYLGASEVKLPNGQTRIIQQGSSDLDVPEFNDFMTKVEAWAAERGVYLEFE